MAAMEHKSKRRIRASALPPTGMRRYVRIYAKKSRKMLPSSSSPRSRKGDRPSRSNTPSNATPPSNELPELSDVQCYTCRRRHVKCDRILPTCAKCRKKGVPCLGYQRPLRWADGVAVRGKLKGKSQPVADSKVINIIRNNVQLQAENTLKEAADRGLHRTDNCCNDVVADESQLVELMAYYNSTICAERITVEQTKFIDRRITPLSHETAQRLPRTVVNCILGIAAVHMASRNPGNYALERLALETKVNVFQSHNRLLQMPQNQIDQQPDVIICSGILIFAMDLFEHGMSRWMIHTLGSMQVMAHLGGFESLSLYYPHLHVPFFHVCHFETMWAILSHIPITKPKQASRRALEMLCHSSLAKRKIFNPCPTPLTLAVWDVGACAQRVFGSADPIGFTDMHIREQILLDVLSFQPEDNTRAVKNDYYQDNVLAEASLRSWDVIGSAWKAAMTILVLRYLYFGKSNLSPQPNGRRSLTPSLATQAGASFAPQAELGINPGDFDLSAFIDDSTDPDTLPDYLSAGLYLDDPHSRSPSPLPSPRYYTEPPSSKIWDTRYEIHDEAFVTLATSISALHGDIDPIDLRYVLVPVLILALVSRPQSEERMVCFSIFAKFKSFMTSLSLSPIGGEELEFDVPWEKLDAYSETIERERRDSVVSTISPMARSAPEWNWWDMLKHIDMNMSWPVTAGTSHIERGSEFWAFKLMSSVLNDECFNVWLQEPGSSQASASST